MSCFRFIHGMLFRSPQSELLKKRNRKASPELKGFAKAFRRFVNAKDPSDSQGIGTLKFDSHVACWQQRCHSPNVDCPLAAISKQPGAKEGDRLIRLIPTPPGVFRVRKSSRFSSSHLQIFGGPAALL